MCINLCYQQLSTILYKPPGQEKSLHLDLTTEIRRAFHGMITEVTNLFQLATSCLTLTDAVSSFLFLKKNHVRRHILWSWKRCFSVSEGRNYWPASRKENNKGDWWNCLNWVKNCPMLHEKKQNKPQMMVIRKHLNIQWTWLIYTDPRHQSRSEFHATAVIHLCSLVLII